MSSRHRTSAVVVGVDGSSARLGLTWASHRARRCGHPLLLLTAEPLLSLPGEDRLRDDVGAGAP